MAKVKEKEVIFTKKMNTYPPLQLIKEITQRSPSIWEDIDQAARNQRRESLWRPDIYITAQCLEEDVLNRYYQKPKMTASLSAAALSILASWRRCKEVYRFAPEMELLLYRQAGCKVPVDVLYHLPYSSFYIETPQLMGSNCHGFFISLDQAVTDQADGPVKLLRCFACGSLEGTGISIIELPLGEGKNLADEALSAAIKAANSAQVCLKDAEAFLSLYTAQAVIIISSLCQLILYIMAQNADVSGEGRVEPKPPRPAGTVGSPIEIKDKYREVRGWDVGYKVVDKMASAKRTQAAEREGDGGREQSAPAAEAGPGHARKPPVPHLRCGHWQTFWVGKREPNNPNRKLLLKWIAPTFVNCGHDPAECLPVAINQYRNNAKKK